MSGQLDQTLTRLHTLYQEEGAFAACASWPDGATQIVYFAVAIYVGYRVIGFYMGSRQDD